MAKQSPTLRNVSYSEKPVVLEPSPAGGEIPEFHLADRGWTLLIARVLFSVIFILASFAHFTPAYVDYATNNGVLYANLLVPLAGVIAGVGGLSILLGYRTRMGAALIILFLIPVTLMMHAFWTITDPGAQALQKVMFLKNIGLIAGALYIARFGAGRISLDARRRRANRD